MWPNDVIFKHLSTGLNMDIGTALAFESRYTVDRSGCWLWTAARNSDGYGTMHVGPKTMLAHRVAFLLYVSELGEKVGVLHACDTPACVVEDLDDTEYGIMAKAIGILSTRMDSDERSPSLVFERVENMNALIRSVLTRAIEAA